MRIDQRHKLKVRRAELLMKQRECVGNDMARGTFDLYVYQDRMLPMTYLRRDYHDITEIEGTMLVGPKVLKAQAQLTALEASEAAYPVLDMVFEDLVRQMERCQFDFANEGILQRV